MTVSKTCVRVAACLLTALAYCVAEAEHPPLAAPDGYAAQNGGTTGGGAAEAVTVSSASEFKEAVSGEEPRVVIVQGRLDVGGTRIDSNKTIVGADTESGLYGGTIGLRGKNCILQNLTFGPAPGDVLEVSGGENVFITKCEFYGSTDELCSIVRGSDFVTVSWCKFHFPAPDSHSFPHLIGNRDDRTSDRGRLRVTMHHNWYGKGCRSRMPRVRYGHVHIYNNYYAAEDNNYCIGTGVESHVRVERCVFKGVKRPWNDMGGMQRDAEIGWRDLQFIDCEQPTYAPNKWPVFSPPYDAQMDDVGQVVAAVTDDAYGAGNKRMRTSGRER